MIAVGMVTTKKRDSKNALTVTRANGPDDVTKTVRREFPSGIFKNQNRLQWGRSNLVDPAEWPKIGSLNRRVGGILSIFPRKKQPNIEFIKFLQPDPGNFPNLVFRDGPNPVSSERMFCNYS